jgi:acetolactate synthase-1/2/3 large subunit
MQNVDLIVKTLEAAGVRWAFGVPSGPVLPLIEALRESGIQYTLTASETTAGFMAQAVGALTGIPGVCISTLGPGATNLATGVGAAWLDRTPLIAITCNVETPWLERRVQMRIDHQALFRPLTKASFQLRTDYVAGPLAEALELACAEPPGPVHLDLPEDVGLAAATEPVPELRVRRPLAPVPAEALERVRRALAESRRPLLVCGLELARSKHPARLLDLVERQGMPFVLSMHAKSFLPESHPSYAGMLGRARRSDVQSFIRRADLIVGIGFDPVEINYEEWAGGTPIVHLGTEPAEEGKSLHFAVNAGGDLDGAIGSLAEMAPQSHDWTRDEIAAHRVKLDRALRPSGCGFSPHHVLDVLRPKLAADAILAYDVGAHTHQIATQWRTDLSNTCLSTNGWSSMGYGIPAAYAAKLVHPDRTVVGIVGDGCFQMTAGELTVARRLGLAVPIIVLNDGWLSLLKVKQEHRDYSVSGVYLGDPPPSPAHYFGVPCRGAHDEAQLADALDWALGLEGPSVVEAFIDPAAYSLTVYD